MRTDFYDEYIKGKTVLINFLYTQLLYVFNDPTDRHSLVSVDATTSEILETVGRLRGQAKETPAGGSAALSEITIDAGPGVVWTSGGVSSTPAIPLKVTAKKGQTLVFGLADPGSQLVILFSTTNLVLLTCDDPATKPGAVLKQTDTLGRYGKPVDPAPNPQELARFRSDPGHHHSGVLFVRRSPHSHGGERGKSDRQRIGRRPYERGLYVDVAKYSASLASLRQSGLPARGSHEFATGDSDEVRTRAAECTQQQVGHQGRISARNGGGGS